MAGSSPAMTSIRACTHKTRRATRPLFPQKLTFYSAICMSALCHQRTLHLSNDLGQHYTYLAGTAEH
jgi:hypothetical protein